MIQRMCFFLSLMMCGFHVLLTASDSIEQQENEIGQLLEENIPFEVPETFFINQHWFSWTRTFDIEVGSSKIGTLHRRLLSLSTEYVYCDAKNTIQATARKRFFSFGSVFDVKDKDDRLIGTTEQRFSFFRTFEIFSPERQSLGIAKMNFWHTKYTIYDPVTNETFVEMSRPFFCFKPYWTVTITNREIFNRINIDPCLFIFIMAYQTDSDVWNEENARRNRALKIDFLNSPKSNKDNQWARLRNDLENYRPNFGDKPVSEENFLYVENYVEKFLNETLLALDTLSQQKESALEIPINEEESHYQGMQCLLPLFEDRLFPDEHKRALFLMLDANLQSYEK